MICRILNKSIFRINDDTVRRNKTVQYSWPLTLIKEIKSLTLLNKLHLWHYQRNASFDSKPRKSESLSRVCLFIANLAWVVSTGLCWVLDYWVSSSLCHVFGLSTSSYCAIMPQTSVLNYVHVRPLKIRNLFLITASERLENALHGNNCLYLKVQKTVKINWHQNFFTFLSKKWPNFF